ncbi:MGDG synthase family glycosyltransferase [Variovorax sp. RT4R15]|uniref:MGDG synthase family glycosyltransferase n=1 Tax=Variovorax sp. RT4R15 TaxID=3443737 RepID=UPI003F478E56
MTRLLILSVSAGNGHVRAAQALAATAEALNPPCSAVHIDAMAHVAGGFRKVYTDWYIKLVNRAPEVWSYLHQKADSTPHSATSQRLRRGIERVSAGGLLREIHRAKPKAIVCTHFLPAELLMRERNRGRLDCPVWLQVTDYDLHNMWIVPGMAGYLAATEEVAFRMRARGLPADRIHVTGIPVMPVFSQPDAPELARDACVSRLGLDPARKVILMASGGAGVGDLPSMVERVLALGGSGSDFQVIAVAGRNAAAHEALKALAQRMPGRLVALGFTNEMEKLMAAADLVVTKPGGLTISECLALGKPMLLVSPIPGQEEHNAGFLMEEGAAWLAYDSIGLEYKVAGLMAAPEHLARMAHKSRSLGKPDAARRVLDCVLGA